MQVSVEHWHRQGDVWVVATRNAGERIELVAFGIVIELDELYADLPLQTSAGSRAEPAPD
jgi:hypothetical protein